MATRYEARPTVAAPGGWIVDGDYSTILTGIMSESESKICAFALNAIADGMTLIAGRPFSLKEEDTRQYDGPTEGVSP